MTTEPRSRDATRGRVRGSAGLAIAIMVTNLTNYGYTVLAAHTIGKVAFGAFTALLAVVLVVNVLSLGLQATGARRIAAEPEAVVAIERVVLGVGLRCALVLTALMLALGPILNLVLHLHSLPAALMVALATFPLTLMGAQSGVLQGERRWEPLAMVYLSQGVGRIGVGVVLVLIWPNELAAMAGVALGAWIPIIVGWVALRRPRVDAPRDKGHPGLDLLREVGHSSQALLAFFALSNTDILLARATLSHSDAGLYAGGLILVKAVLFLPQSIVILAFPSMSIKGASRRTMVLAVGLSAAIGACVVVGVALLPALAERFIGGGDFSGIAGNLWKFAIVGTLLSIVQLLVYSALARRQVRAVAMIWTTLALLVVLGVTVIGSVYALVNLVVVLDALLFVGLFATALTQGQRSDAVDTP